MQLKNRPLHESTNSEWFVGYFAIFPSQVLLVDRAAAGILGISNPFSG
jgi:hypothetical protein